MSRTVIAAAAAAVCVALTGCGASARFVAASDSVDTGKVEQNVAAMVAARYKVPESAVRVDCPSVIPDRRGMRVECGAEVVNGRSARVFVTITSDPRTSLKFDVAIVGNISSELIERSLMDRAARSYDLDPSALRISCPSGVHSATGAHLSCAVRTLAGDRARIRVTITSKPGQRTAYRARLTRLQPA